MRKIKDFFANVFGKLFKRGLPKMESSRFRRFYDALNKKDDIYPAVREAADLCDESLDNINLRQMLTERGVLLAQNAEELKQYAELDEESVEYLKGMQARLAAVSREISVVKTQFMGFSGSVVHLADLEEEAQGAVTQLRDVEQLHRDYGQDMYILRDEKEGLETERDRLLFLTDFLYKFTMGVVGVFTVAAISTVLIWAFTEIMEQRTMVLLTSVMLLAVIVISATLYLLRKRLSGNLKLNHKKQNRAVGLINTKTAAYAQYSTSLKYFYKKYKVENAEALEQNIQQYQRYKQLSKRYDGLRSILKQTEEGLLNFLNQNDIQISTTTEHFSVSVDPDERRHKHAQLITDRQTVERSIEAIDTRQQEIFEQLTKLMENEATEPVISAMMTEYNNIASGAVSEPGSQA